YGQVAGAPESQIRSGAVDVTAGVIALGETALAIGSGSAVNGQDAALIDAANAFPGDDRANRLPTPLPALPHASFESPNGVDVGSLDIAGGYLYVRAPGASVVGVETPLQAFNFRPHDDADPLLLAALDGALTTGVLTYLF